MPGCSGAFFIRLKTEIYDQMVVAAAEKKWMRKVLALAVKGGGFVNPNPMVGALLVHDDQIIGSGYHEYFGGPHAEVNAIRDAEENHPELISHATLYVNLEPCSHIGKTPPCTDLILEKKIPRVVIAMQDPNPLVAGKGIARLEAAGVQVRTGIMSYEAAKLNEVFIKFITTGKPFVVLKSAATLDGKIATVTNASRWITGEPSRRIVHRLRHRLSSVMVGVETVLADDPLLNVRLPGRWKQPFKIVADSSMRIPPTSRLLTHDPQLTIVATSRKADYSKVREIERLGAQVVRLPERGQRLDLVALTNALGTMGIDSILLEGGSTIAFSALREGIVDKVVCFIAPKILGGANAPSPVGGDGIPLMEDAILLKNMNVKRIGEDLMVEAMVAHDRPRK